MIEQKRERYSVTRLCRALNVSLSGYYAWRKRDVSQHDRNDQRLTKRIKQLFVNNRRVYGSPRIWKELRAEGEGVGQRRVARLMRQAGLKAIHPRKRVVTTRSNPAHLVAPNLLARDFSADRPNQKWCSDITYIPTDTGWIYLAVIIDLYSRMVVGWATSRSIDSQLVEQAWCNAVHKRQPKESLIHHSDRGSQYTGQPYQAQLAQLPHVTISMSRRANCLDNAVAESFFGTLKNEAVSRTRYRSHTEAHLDLFDYIEGFYNRKRRHSTLGYISPADFEKQYSDRLN